MLIAIDKGLDEIKMTLEDNGYEVTYIDSGVPCDAYIYKDVFNQNLEKLKPGEQGTLLINSSIGYDNILNTLKTRLITPLFE